MAERNFNWIALTIFVGFISYGPQMFGVSNWYEEADGVRVPMALALAVGFALKRTLGLRLRREMSWY